MWPENYPTLDYTFWEAAEKKWREKQYTSSFKYLLDFINPKVRKQYEIEDNKRYCIPHGSSVIYLTLLDSEVNIMCYLAKLDAANIQVVYNRIQLLNTQHVNKMTTSSNNTNTSRIGSTSKATTSALNRYPHHPKACRIDLTTDNNAIVET